MASLYNKYPEATKRAQKAYYEKNKEKWKEYHRKFRSTKEGQLKSILSGVKHRHQKRWPGVPFELSLEDIQVPQKCPVLGIPILFGETCGSPNSPSIDRIDNEKGYTKDNIRVISNRANLLKSNGSLDEFTAIVKYMKKHLKTS